MQTKLTNQEFLIRSEYSEFTENKNFAYTTNAR